MWQGRCIPIQQICLWGTLGGGRGEFGFQVTMSAVQQDFALMQLEVGSGGQFNGARRIWVFLYIGRDAWKHSDVFQNLTILAVVSKEGLPPCVGRHFKLYMLVSEVQ